MIVHSYVSLPEGILNGDYHSHRPIVPSFPLLQMDRSILAAQAAGMEWTAIPKDPERKEWDP